MQNVRNLIFTFTGPVHLAILIHLYNNNIQNDTDNNNNDNNINNITVSATHTQRMSILSPHSIRSSIICNNFVSCSPRNIHN